MSLQAAASQVVSEDRIVGGQRGGGWGVTGAAERHPAADPL